MRRKIVCIIGLLVGLLAEAAGAEGLVLEQEIRVAGEGGYDYKMQVPFIQQRVIVKGGSQEAFFNNAENSSYFDLENDGVPEVLFVGNSSTGGRSKILIYDGATRVIKNTVIVDSATLGYNNGGLIAGFHDVDGDGSRELVGEFRYGSSNRLLVIEVKTSRIKASLPGYSEAGYSPVPDGYDGYAIYDIDNDTYPEILCRWHNPDSTSQLILRIYGSGNGMSKKSMPALSKNILPTINTMPNPSRGATRIEYYVTSSEDNVTLDLFDLDGKLLRTLVNKPQKMGEYAVMWDGKNENGRKLAAGQYYFRLRVGMFVSTKKMISLE